MHCHAVLQGEADMVKKAEKEILNNILDQLIPANEQKKIPSAGDIDIAAFIIERASKNLALEKELERLVKIAKDLA